MCGLVGFSGNSKKQSDPGKLMFLLYYLSQTRGKEGTGFFIPELGITKNAEEAEKFLKKASNSVTPSNIFIGHVRAKTHGPAIAENAHPFNYGTITGAHNGVIVNSDDLLEEIGEEPIDYAVDSMAIFKRLSHDKNPTVFTKLFGAASVIFYDSENKDNLYCWTNGKRPLHYGLTSEGMYIASTKEALEIIQAEDIKEFKPGHLYTISNGVFKGKPLKMPYRVFNEEEQKEIKLDKISLIDFTWEDLVGFTIKIGTTYQHSPIESNSYHTVASTIPKSNAAYYGHNTKLDPNDGVKLISQKDSTKEAKIYTKTDLELPYLKVFFTKGGYVTANTALYIPGEKKKYICKEGDVGRITGAIPCKFPIDPTGKEVKVRFYNDKTKDSYFVPLKFLTPLVKDAEIEAAVISSGSKLPKKPVITLPKVTETTETPTLLELASTRVTEIINKASGIGKYNIPLEDPDPTTQEKQVESTDFMKLFDFIATDTSLLLKQLELILTKEQKEELNKNKFSLTTMTTKCNATSDLCLKVYESYSIFAQTIEEQNSVNSN